MKFSAKDFISKCKHKPRGLFIFNKKSLSKNFVLSSVYPSVTMNHISFVAYITYEKIIFKTSLKIQSNFFNYWWKANEAYSIYNICQVHLNTFWYCGFHSTHRLLFNDMCWLNTTQLQSLLWNHKWKKLVHLEWVTGTCSIISLAICDILSIISRQWP